MSNSAHTAVGDVTHHAFDVDRVRASFPILRRSVHGKPLVYLDNAATSQKPGQVIDAIARYYREENANVHRGVHYLSETATEGYERSRKRVVQFLGNADVREIIFVRGTTEAVNLVARSFVLPLLRAGDEIMISALEHHSNIVPWQMICEERGARLVVIPMTDAGELDLEAYPELFSAKTRFLALTHISNALGTINPVKEMIAVAHNHGVPVLIDGAQAVPHMKVDVLDLDCEFYAFSAHKMYGPTGIGVLYGKRPLLEAMPPYQGGGDMIKSVTFGKTIYNDLPYKFEAGTPNIAAGVAFGAAIDFLDSLGIDLVAEHEHRLLAYATEAVAQIPGVRIIGTAREKAAVLSFIHESIHPHDIGTILDSEGIAVRTGHHCAQPVMQRLHIPATARASFACYNTTEEIDVLVQGIHKVIKVLG